VVVVICSSSVRLESKIRYQPSSQSYYPLNSSLTPRCGPKTYLNSSLVFCSIRLTNLHCLHRPASSAVGACFHAGSQSISGSSGSSRLISTHYSRTRQCCFAPSGFEAEESYDSAQMTPRICVQKLEAALGERNAAFESSPGSATCSSGDSSSRHSSIVEELHSARSAKIRVGSSQALQQHLWSSCLTSSSSSRPLRS